LALYPRHDFGGAHSLLLSLSAENPGYATAQSQDLCRFTVSSYCRSSRLCLASSSITGQSMVVSAAILTNVDGLDEILAGVIKGINVRDLYTSCQASYLKMS